FGRSGAEGREPVSRALAVTAGSQLLSPNYRPQGMISSDAILSPSTPKKNRRFTGLPGKLPVSRLVTTTLPASCSQAKGSLVYSYLVETSAFHCLIAPRPL